MARILVVDDQPEMRWLLRRVLELENHEVFEAKDGLESIDLAMEIKPNLIIMDMMMPVLDGREACQRIKDIPEISEVPIILLTTPWGPMDEWLGLELTCADRFVSKPFDNARLVQDVQELLAQRSQPSSA